MTGKIRVTIDLTPELHARLEDLQTFVEAVSKADVIRQALQLYEYVAKRTIEGCTFHAVSKTGHEETLVFMGFPVVAAGGVGDVCPGEKI